MENKKITFDELEKFSQAFKKNCNKALQNKLKTQDIFAVCAHKGKFKDNEFVFNVDLGPCKIYNQCQSLRCWLFATLNLIKNNMAQNLNQNIMDFELSPTYLTFYDKLEKANHAYQTLIDLKVDKDFQLCDYEDHALLTNYFKAPVRENGKVVFARALLKKYGIVPFSVMPERYNSTAADNFNTLFTNKVKGDLQALLKLKKLGKDVYKAKEKMLAEVYSLLAHVLGEPPKTFSYAYMNNAGKRVTLKNMTPLEFYRKYCTLSLDNFVQIANLPNYKMFTKYERRYTQNIVEDEAYNFINVPQSLFTSCTLKQLKGGTPVLVGLDNRRYRDVEQKILDTRNYDFDKLFGIKNMTKQGSLETFETRSRHAMAVRGVYLKNGKPIRWKVEDTAGKDARNDGYYVMNQNFFEQAVFFAYIDKKYLPKRVIQLLDSTPTLYNFEGAEI